MLSTMTLTNLSGGASITINRPLMSYETEIHLPVEVGQAQNGQYFFFDNGSDYDYRICTMRLQLPLTQKESLNNFLRSDAAASGARGAPCLLRWSNGDGGSVNGDISDGFYPFGPDLYCQSGVWVQPVKQEQGGALWQPYNYFEDKLSILLLKEPPSGSTGMSTYPIPANTTDSPDQGSSYIGSATGLMFPQDLYKPKTSYACETTVSLGGDPSTLGMTSDNYETSFTFTGNLGKAALLTAFLTGSSGRASDITVGFATAPESGFIFGADNLIDQYGFITKLLGSSHGSGEMVLKITHDSYNRWSMPLKFWMKS